MNLYEMIAGCVLCICFFTFLCFAIVYISTNEKTDNKEIEKPSALTRSSTEITGDNPMIDDMVKEFKEREGKYDTIDFDNIIKEEKK